MEDLRVVRTLFLVVVIGGVVGFVGFKVVGSERDNFNTKIKDLTQFYTKLRIGWIVRRELEDDRLRTTSYRLSFVVLSV